MKGFTVAAAAVAALSGGATAHRQHRNAHQELFAKRAGNDSAVCVPECKTYYTTYYGEPTLIPDAPPKPTSTAQTTPKTTPPAVVPTPIAQQCPTPGTYTFPATTLVVTETVNACAPATTKVPAGNHTLGGVTTVVTTATTVVCPVATVKTEDNGDVTSVVTQTTYFCPAAGTYTIGGTTTSVTSETEVVFPTVTSFPPGTYTAPAVTTVVETQTVVYCPFTSDVPAPTATATATAAPSVSATPSKTPDTPSTSPSSPPLGGGNQWAMTYTPYGNGGVCKSASDVDSDIARIAGGGFKTVRVYSTDCNTLPNVGAACRKHGIKMIIGVFVGAPGCSNGSPQVAEQIKAIKEWAQWDLVEMCVVGNEALFNGFCTPNQLKDLIGEVKTVLRSGGCNAPITTTDTVGGWEAQGVADVICPVVDVVSANIHAYFNGAVQPEGAGKFVSGQLQQVKNLCGGKEGYIMETGWPTGGKCIGTSCPGTQQQEVAIKSIQQEIGGKSVFFSWTDDDWKQPGDCGCENHFGCGRLFSS